MGKSSDVFKISLQLYVCKQMKTFQKRAYLKLDYDSWYFSFRSLSVPNLSMKAYLQEHNLLSECAFETFTYAYPGNSISCFSVFLFLSLKFILFRSLPNRNVRSALHLYHWQELTHHELTIRTAVELHLNATCYAQHPALKLFLKKCQSVTGCCELFVCFRYKSNLMETKSYQRYNVKRKISKFTDSGLLMCMLLIAALFETAKIKMIDCQNFNQIFF